MNKTRVHTGMHTAVLSRTAARFVLQLGTLVLVAVAWLFGWGDISAQADAAETQRQVFQFHKARMNKLVLHQPNLVAFLSGTGSGALNADITDNHGTVTFSSGVDQRLWARMNGRWSETGRRKDKYGFGAMGLHAHVGPNLVFGGMVEADYLSQAGAASGKEGVGVMAGPYFLAHSAKQPLFFEGRLLHGRASDGIWLSADGKGRPESRRGLVQLRMSGNLRYGITTLSPSVLASYATEDVLRGASRGQGSRLGQINMGLDFRHALRQMNGAPFFLMGGGTLSSTSTRSYGREAVATPKQRNRRGRVNLGVSYFTQAGGTVVINSFMDGLGVPARQNYGVKAAFDIKF